MTDPRPREGARWGDDPVPAPEPPPPDRPSQEEIVRKALIDRFGPDSVKKATDAFYRLKYASPDSVILRKGEIAFVMGLLEAINRHVRDAASFGEALSVPIMLDGLLPYLQNDIILKNISSWNNVRFTFGKQYKKINELWDRQDNNKTATGSAPENATWRWNNKKFWFLMILSLILFKISGSYFSIKFSSVNKRSNEAFFVLTNNTIWSGDIVIWVSNHEEGELCPVVRNMAQFSTDRIRLSCPGVGGNYKLHASWASNKPDLAKRAYRLAR